MKRDEVKRVVDKIVGLPTFPVILNKCSELLQDPFVSTSKMAKVISKDQSITSKLLRLVNSALYGFPHRISSVNQAILILGFNNIRTLILSFSVFDTLLKDNKSLGFDMGEFWKHSIGCGAAAKVIGSRMGIRQPEESFVAGLLHDIGKVVLSQFFLDDFISVLKIAQEKNILFIEAEEQVLGITHAEIGGYLANRWNLPDSLTKVIIFHHTPSLIKDNTNLVFTVHLADIICRGLGVGSPGDDLVPQIDVSIWDDSGLTMRMLEKLLPEVDEEIEKANSFLSILFEK